MIILLGGNIEMPNIADEILKTIKYAVDKKAVNCDRTYQSIIKEITPKGYVILDRVLFFRLKEHSIFRLY